MRRARQRIALDALVRLLFGYAPHALEVPDSLTLSRETIYVGQDRLTPRYYPRGIARRTSP